jgi:hypothetical protein
MGGVGKTVLAAALVHDPDARLAFPYGIVWLAFGRAANAMAQLAMLARAVTGQSAGYGSVGEAQVDLARLLKDLRLLIVLDDVWEPGLVDAFRGITPGCQLLITTRQQSVVGRTNAAYEVDLLDPWGNRAPEAFARASLDALETGWLPVSEQQNLQIVLDASVQTLKRPYVLVE